MSGVECWVVIFDKKKHQMIQHPVPSGEVVDWVVNEGKFNKWQLVLACRESGK